ncbi:MAG: Ig-like domain-containing protein [Cytophagales bacterium]
MKKNTTTFLAISILSVFVASCKKKTSEVSPSNAAPVVTITSPSNNGSTYQYSDSNTYLYADAYDTDGSVKKVEFYEGSKLLGTDSTGSSKLEMMMRTTSNEALTYYIPYSFEFGNHSVKAVAYDDKGAQTTSSMVTFTVISPSVVIAAPAAAAK